MSHPDIAEDNVQEFVTVTIAGQLFGLPINRVHDVFLPDSITPVPLSIPEVAGVLNLRGRIVTIIDMRRRLNLPRNDSESGSMSVGIEHGGESYGLIIDGIGEVLRLKNDDVEPSPSNLDPRWRVISAGVYRLDKQLMVVLDVDKILDFGLEQAAA